MEPNPPVEMVPPAEVQQLRPEVRGPVRSQNQEEETSTRPTVRKHCLYLDRLLFCNFT